MPLRERRRSIACSQTGGGPAFSERYGSYLIWEQIAAGIRFAFRGPIMDPDLVVLIVEDEPLLRYSMAYALRGDGWLILEASTGEEAVAYLEAGEKIDIVFTDITLGGLLNGWDSGCLQNGAMRNLHHLHIWQC